MKSSINKLEYMKSRYYKNHSASVKKQQEYRNGRKPAIKLREQLRHKKEPWKVLFYNAQQRARKKGLPFDLTKEWLKERWTGHCELTGLKFRVGKERVKGTYSASIDKIVPEKGYVKNNCRIILMGINALKGIDSDKDMYKIAKALVENYETH